MKGGEMTMKCKSVNSKKKIAVMWSKSSLAQKKKGTQKSNAKMKKMMGTGIVEDVELLLIPPYSLYTSGIF